jgi:hypothetical protein
VLAPTDSSDRWRATYVFDHHVSRLRFERPAGFYREGVWDVVTPGWSLERDGALQVLVASESAGARRVTVEFPVYTKTLQKEYEFFVAFSDDSVAVYTGHLSVFINDGSDDGEVVRALDVVPPDGANVVVRGVVGIGRTVVSDLPDDGTYLYIGGILPVETDAMVAILDPGAPSWLIDQLSTSVPTVMATYATGFGEALPTRPTVLFNFDTAATSGLSSGGGTLTGLIQMSASGDGWRTETPRTREQLLGLVAHEAAHLWNGQLHEYEDPADSWMHEGSADAFAGNALCAAGVIDKAGLAARRTRALNECAQGLIEGSLDTSADRGQFRNFYSCGEVIAAWSVAAQPDGTEEALFGLWRAVLGPPGHRYNRHAYFHALSTRGVEAVAIDALRQFIGMSHTDPSAALVALFKAIHVDLLRPQRPAPGDRPPLAVLVMRHLMSTSCQGRMSFSVDGPRLRTSAIQACAPFRTALSVATIEDYGLRDGDRAFDAAHEMCAARQPVRLGLEGGGEVAVPCLVPLATRPDVLGYPEG